MDKEELAAVFRNLGVDFSAPGFYDDPNFQAAEKRDPRFLEAYAEYIENLALSQDYLTTARATIARGARFVHERLVAEGLKGRCLDVAMVLSRFLEKEGVWNYVVKGGLTIMFDEEAGMAPTYIAPIMLGSNPAAVGHAWLCAPPFRVVDVAFAQQDYTHGQEKYLAGIVAKEQVESVDVAVEDLLDPEVRRDFALRYGRPPTLEDVARLCPSALRSARPFGAFCVRVPSATLKYVATAITASDAPLRGITNITFCGKSPAELYEEFSAAPREEARAKPRRSE